MSAFNDKFFWREAKPGVWQRNVDEVEEFYFALAKLYEGSGRMFFAITGHVSLRVAVPVGESFEAAEQLLDTTLRKAWLALRFDHPTIASKVHQGADGVVKTYHTCQNAAEVASWLEETLVSVSTGQTGTEWANSDPPAPKLPTLFAINVQDTDNSTHSPEIRRDLVLRSPHDIIDGVGTLLLLNNYVSLVSKFYDALTGPLEPPVLDGSEVKNLSPPFRIAASVPETLSETQQRRLYEMSEQKEAAAKNGGSVTVLGIPFIAGSLRPGKHQRLALFLSEAQTNNIVNFSKSIGATVTQVFHSAIALATRDIQQQNTQSTRVRYVNYILRNERKFCNEPFSTARHAAAVYHSVSGKALVVDMDAQGHQNQRQEFLDIVRIVQTFYGDVRSDLDHYAFVPAIFKAVTPPLPTSAGDSVLPVPPPKALPSVSISSMGKVDSIVLPSQGTIKVYDPWVTGEELGNGLGLFLGTFRGQLCLSAAYNDAWHMEQEVMGFLQRCKDLVLENVEDETA